MKWTKFTDKEPQDEQLVIFHNGENFTGIVEYKKGRLFHISKIANTIIAASNYWAPIYGPYDNNEENR